MKIDYFSGRQSNDPKILTGNQFAAVHGEGLAHILSTRGLTSEEQNDTFINQLLVVMSGQIVRTSRAFHMLF